MQGAFQFRGVRDSWFNRAVPGVAEAEAVGLQNDARERDFSESDSSGRCLVAPAVMEVKKINRQ